jgi:putative methionine-R-sulfoxide reductase with GAF domain
VVAAAVCWLAACDDETRSEIVVPVFQGEGDARKLIAVFDIDSATVGTFDLVDKAKLEELVKLLV